ncbi:TPA: hypothetical protein ACF1UP_002475 [Enterococcus hirae]|nr:hypothetical protein [Enterococcus hirae]
MNKESKRQFKVKMDRCKEVATEYALENLSRRQKKCAGRSALVKKLLIQWYYLRQGIIFPRIGQSYDFYSRRQFTSHLRKKSSANFGKTYDFYLGDRQVEMVYRLKCNRIGKKLGLDKKVRTLFFTINRLTSGILSWKKMAQLFGTDFGFTLFCYGLLELDFDEE